MGWAHGRADGRAVSCYLRSILSTFSWAHSSEHSSTGSSDDARWAIMLEERRVEILGKMGHFRDQGKALCNIAQSFEILGDKQKAEGYYLTARDLGAAHGSFSLECRACAGLGIMAMKDGRHRYEEGVELLRNALAASNLVELQSEESHYQLNALQQFIPALFVTDAFDELEPIIPRCREAAQAESRRLGRLSEHELRSFLFSAHLHEVLCICTPCWKSIDTARPLHSTQTESICHALHRARVRAHALLEPSQGNIFNPPLPSLSRHAEDPSRLRRRCALCSTSCARTGHKTRRVCFETWRVYSLTF